MPTGILAVETIALIKKFQPKSILEIGPGFGKYGMLCREYLELWGHRRYHRDEWKVKIDAVEVFPNYITPIHQYVYDNIYIGDVKNNLDIIPNYELLLICGTIEHLEKEMGREILRRARNYIATTPNDDCPQKESYGNPHEKHISRWYPADFRDHQLITTALENREIILGYKLSR